MGHEPGALAELLPRAHRSAAPRSPPGRGAHRRSRSRRRGSGLLEKRIQFKEDLVVATREKDETLIRYIPVAAYKKNDVTNRFRFVETLAKNGVTMAEATKRTRETAGSQHPFTFINLRGLREKTEWSDRRAPRRRRSRPSEAHGGRLARRKLRAHGTERRDGSHAKGLHGGHPPVGPAGAHGRAHPRSPRELRHHARRRRDGARPRGDPGRRGVPTERARSLVTAQGKGVTLAAAKASGLMEAVEAFHAERVKLPLRYASYRELRAEEPVVDPWALPRTRASRFHDDAQILWVSAWDMMGAAGTETSLVPFECVHTNFTRCRFRRDPVAS